jgi:hypothetical protein
LDPNGSRDREALVHEQAIQRVVLSKWADYRPVLPAATVRFLDRDPYLDAARHDASVIAELAAGWFDDFATEFREPVLTDVDGQLVTVCAPLMREIIDPEPPRIQRAYVEGSFMRRMFRLLVEGRGWEADAQVRDVMARHYPFHLVAVEAVEGERLGGGYPAAE